MASFAIALLPAAVEHTDTIHPPPPTTVTAATVAGSSTKTFQRPSPPPPAVTPQTRRREAKPGRGCWLAAVVVRKQSDLVVLEATATARAASSGATEGVGAPVGLSNQTVMEERVVAGGRLKPRMAAGLVTRRVQHCSTDSKAG
jgi:hypothetical protein